MKMGAMGAPLLATAFSMGASLRLGYPDADAAAPQTQISK
jgi:hypothetical protein